MTKTAFLQAIANIDEDILEKAIEARGTPAKKRKPHWLVLAAAAACVVLVGSLVLANVLRAKIPVYDDAHYTAEQVADQFGGSFRGDGTSFYTEVFVPNAEALNLTPLPEEEYLPIYESADVGVELDEDELRDFADDFLPRLARSLGVAVPEYDPERMEPESLDPHLQVFADAGKDSLLLFQYSQSNRFSLYTTSLEDPLIRLDGEAVTAQPTLSDEELLASLETVRDRLFDIFGVKLDGAKVCRTYDEVDKIPARQIQVFYYDSDAHPLNDERGRSPYSDYISLTFEYQWNGVQYIIDETGAMTDVSINYYSYRISPEKSYPMVAKAKKLPLAEAEELLKKGYVFGGHSCRICTKNQPKVDFSSYDYVEIQYLGIPFYAFYKHIGTAESGNMTFAKTYVPAIEIAGLEEYFDSQTALHDAPK